MPTQVIMPALGMAQDTGRVLRWLRREGDLVAKGEPLLEVETDKVTVEIESPADGTLASVRAAEGDVIPVGTDVAVVLGPGETADDLWQEPAVPPPHSPPAGAREAGRDSATRAVGDARRLASPKARRLAQEHRLALASLSGTGPRGTIVAADVDAALAATAAGGAGSPVGGRARGRVWDLMAERVTASWQTAPHFFLMREVNATALESRRALGRERGSFVTATDLLLKLCGAALREHSDINACWRNGGVVREDEVNIGIAVAVEEGLVVPVVRGVDRLELDAVAARRAELVAAAREGRLRPADVNGGTFTISNLGMYGVDGFFAIVNSPQIAILAAGRISERVVAVDGVPAVRPTLVLGLSFDHRAVDGALGAEFLESLARLIEEPAGLVA